MQDPKPVWKSKTIWFNVIGVAGTLLSHAAELLPPHYAAVALAIGNLALRLVTEQPVTFDAG